MIKKLYHIFYKNLSLILKSSVKTALYLVGVGQQEFTPDTIKKDSEEIYWVSTDLRFYKDIPTDLKCPFKEGSPELKSSKYFYKDDLVIVEDIRKSNNCPEHQQQRILLKVNLKSRNKL